MPDPNLFLAFVLAVTVLMLVPGPNVALIVANSVAYGARYGLLTVAGTSSAMIVQLGIVALGMTEALHAAATWFEWIRWLGVIYLVWLGIKEWRAPPVDLTRTKPEPRSARAIYARALFVSLTNPKTLLFYGAFFPQFVRPDYDIGLQVAVLSVTFLALAILIDGAWAVAAGRARRLLASRGRLRNRLSGGLLMGAGLGLAMARARP
jgi:threonine/homoserine/homoserine lactone efflux protein